MYSPLVSGKKKKSMRKVTPESISVSHIPHRQLLSGIEKPLKTGPKAGPPYAKKDHAEIAYGTLLKGKISAAEAAPVASTGPPKNPWINRMTMNPGKFDTPDPIAVMIMKRKKEIMYGRLRPTIGSSDMGLNSNGPNP